MKKYINRTITSVKNEFTDTEHKSLKLFWIFLAASFIGALVEILYVGCTSGIWMSRSSLLFGQFSVVWGLGATLMTILLHRLKSQDDRYVFFCGTVLGAGFEYICSLFTELVFGVVFWDYSGLPFNLNGRINLLYCFFWGFVAVVWIKHIYPLISRLIDHFFIKTNIVFASICTIFMIANIIFSSFALIRYQERRNSLPPDNAIERFLDRHFDDRHMRQRYQNMELPDNTAKQIK